MVDCNDRNFNSSWLGPYNHEAECDKTLAEFNKVIRCGWAHAEKGEYDRAIADFTSLIKMNPYSCEAYYNRGEAYAEKGEYDKAIADFTRDIDLGDIYCHFARGLAYAKMGRKSEAIVDFDVIVKLSEDPELIPKAKQEIERLQT